jgi:hypothetical protein
MAVCTMAMVVIMVMGSKRVAGGLDLAEKGQIINSYTIHITASMFRLIRFVRVIQETAAHS